MLTILLDQAAIEEALTNYIGETTLGVDLTQKKVSIKLTAGRGGNGLRAEVNINEVPHDAFNYDAENDVEESSPLLATDVIEGDTPVVGPFD